MPDRTPAAPYGGPERRQDVRRAEDMHPPRHGPFSFWQWAVVLFGFFVVIALVLTAAIYGLSKRADENARRGNAAICVQVAYLDTQVMTLESTIRQNPSAPETPARERGARELRRLVAQLRREIPDCREALR
jgi:hypothetical protein